MCPVWPRSRGRPGGSPLPAACAALALLVAACTLPTPLTLPTPTPAPASRPYSLGLSVPDVDREPWRSLAHGARDEAALSRVELSLPSGDGASGEEQQVRQIRDLTARPVDFLLLGGGDGPNVRPAIDEAVGRGIPIGALSSLVPVDRGVFKVGPDRFGLGRVQAECLGTALGGRGTVALLAGPRSDAPSLEHAEGFKGTLARQFSNVQLVAEREDALDRRAAADQVSSWLQRWPDLAGVAAGADPWVNGALDALGPAGRLGQTKVASIGLPRRGEDALRGGEIRCAAMQQAVAEGRAAVRNALAYLDSQPYQKYVVSPPMLVTPDNVDRVEWGLIRAP